MKSVRMRRRGGPIRRLAIVFLGCTLGTTSFAAPSRSWMLDASVGAKAGAYRVSLSGWRSIFDHAGRVRLGLGLRASAFGGDRVDYDNRGTVEGNLAESLPIDPSVYALNFAVSGEVDLVSRLALGANLDVFGVATGPTRRTGALEAKVQSGSYFRFGTSDRGALNSEYFALIRVTPRVAIRAGFSHYVTDYRVTDHSTAGSPSSRYQNFDTVPFVAIRVLH